MDMKQHERAFFKETRDGMDKAVILPIISSATKIIDMAAVALLKTGIFCYDQAKAYSDKQKKLQPKS